MCGVSGSVGGVPIEQMNHVLRHRGPDYQGTYKDAFASLGHCLLSIRGENKEASRQPYTKPDSPWVLSFNGQVYNTKELADRFDIPYNDLDTAVLFDLITKVGWSFIDHIDGMYAIALYNSKEKIVRLYRDESGQKPLYIGVSKNKIVFASEIKAIREAGFGASVDQEALGIAASLGYIPGTKTLFSDITKVDAGETVSIFQDFSIQRSYRTLSARIYSGSPEEALSNTVSLHLQSKERVALNLSGGMDSSLLLHEMKTAGHELITYTTAFAGAGESFNEDALLARKLATDYGTEHTEVVITKETYRKNFIESYEILEEPNYNISLPAYLEIAKREGISGDKNRVILSGNGGDEIFGGYSYYGRSLYYDTVLGRMPKLLFNMGKWARTGVYWDYTDPVSRWLSFKYFEFGAVPRDRKVVQRYIQDIADKRRIPFSNPVQNLMNLDRAIWLPGESFMQADKLFMSQSLEVRAPLAYQPLRNYFDARLTTDDYLSQDGNKQFLRSLYTHKLPKYIVARKNKTGWRSPVRLWYDKEMKNLFLSIIDGARAGGVVDWNSVKSGIESTDTWPGKYTFLYLSLAILSNKYGVQL